MTQYMVLRCPQCGKVSAAKRGVKTHACPYCGHRSTIDKWVLVTYADSRTVRDIVRKLNSQRS